jgi:benzoate membrane transport protein
MKIIPIRWPPMLAGILLRFGLQAFASLQAICCCAAACSPPGCCVKRCPRFAVVAALLVRRRYRRVLRRRDRDKSASLCRPEWIAPQFTPALLLSVGVPFFLVTMASQNAPGSPPCRPPAIGYRCRR